ncbi:ParB/RepB/Spo0J family partition protein [Geomonas subterranea]|uniref:ParB/RepB/Spo0J family partition protein n=1 Tax=Geomonas subterranea TaxID=2847989 RepID=A0ABX8LM59_9BACT|nr:ParB/RepB/Spo0J family partition protein [Geomonas subterranea]QXE92426.1 ParB/RepB/Spo0J family partition protein [Geomonas subterranea]QXM09475.1 ParB/RepB/Spo0J family partition protein [Geomonas subterranea]
MTAETKSTTYRKGKIHDISLDLLHRDVDQPRKHFDESELDALKKSIEDKGLLYPVLFRVDENGNNILVSGERRLRAFRSLGKETIPAMRIDSERYDEVALIDNIQRVDLSPVDESEAVFNLQSKYGHTQEQIGNLIGKAQNTVADILGLMKLSPEIREDARHRTELSRVALLKVARIKRPTVQRKAYDALVASLGIPKKEIKRPRLSVTKKAITSTNNTLKCIKSIDIEALGDDRDVVVSKLQELLQEIQNKLGSIGG